MLWSTVHKMWMGGVGDCGLYFCRGDGFRVYFGKGSQVLMVKTPVGGNYNWTRTNILNYNAISVGSIKQENLSRAIEYNSKHAKLLHIGTYNYTFTIYVNTTLPIPRLLTYRGVQHMIVFNQRRDIPYIIFYPNIRPGVIVNGKQWAEDKTVYVDGFPYRVTLGYFYNYTLLVNGEPILKRPQRSVIFIRNDPSGWFSVWPHDGDLAYTSVPEVKDSYNIRNSLSSNYLSVLGSLRRGWNNLTIVVDVYLLDDAIDPVEGMYYITAHLARGEIILSIGPPFIVVLDYKKTVDPSEYMLMLATSILLAGIPTYVLYKRLKPQDNSMHDGMP
ncbi:MAG: hypothetical protein GSR79_00815 [Desulfurococcales archaeon]|nr:hypothetical protein [Desulfurococcales archaeon]